MTWFKIDDTLWGHPKWLATSARARALWVTAGSWSAAMLTDGQVPRHVLPILGGRPRDADELVARGLWTATDDGWTFHDWSAYQPTKDEVEARRDAEREKKRLQRGRGHRGTTRGTDGRFRPVSPGDTPRDTRGDNPGESPGESRGVSPATRPVPSLNPPTPLSDDPSPPAPQRTPATAGGDTEDPFTTFWRTYPRKVGQSQARTAWRRATRDTPSSAILDGLTAALPDLQDREPQFVPEPASWLRRRRWTDAPAPSADPWAHLTRIGPDPAPPTAGRTAP